jgi:hypothetical protein
MLETGQVRILPLNSLLPSPENDKLYKPVMPDDDGIRDLAESIRQIGFNQPVIISTDNFILSGHRRRVAAGVAGLDEIPVTIESISRILPSGQINPEFVRRLEMYNRQREKTLDEKLRESVIKANPQDAHRQLTVYRQQRAAIAPSATIQMRSADRRAALSVAKYSFANAVIDILNSMTDFLPLSVRQIHYLLLNNPPLKHSSKPSSTYINDLKSYKDLCDLTLRLRLMGNIPMHWIADETRPEVLTKCHQDSGEFMRIQMERLLKGYYRNLLQSQPNHVEIIGEKNTLLSIIRPIALNYCIPLTIGRGYSSLPPRYKMAQRYKASGKEKFILLAISDLDPDGEEIAHSFARSMRDDFSIEQMECVKVALTSAQVKEYNLPPGGHVDEKNNKASQKPKKDRFVNRYGENTFELEALPPDVLQKVLDEAIRSVLDVEAFNDEVHQEGHEAAFLDEQRQRMLIAVGAS